MTPDQPSARTRCINAIVELHADFGFPPTVREIAAEMGVSTTRAAHVLRTLRDEGWVNWDRGRVRSVRLVRAWEG